jgi:superfamily II DNA helicase RecQ
VRAPIKASSSRRRRSSASGDDNGGIGEPAGAPVDEEHFERLRAWRFERAEGKPAYTVAANAVLEELLRVGPRSVQALLEIRGIGPAFCEKHGESLLAELAVLDRDDADARGPTLDPVSDQQQLANAPLASPAAPT